MQEERKVVTHGKHAMEWLALLRIFAGGFFFHTGVQKILNPDFYQMMEGMLKGWSDKGGPSWYMNFILNTVLPNSKLFSTLVGLGETAVGFLLILGLLTGIAGIVGAFMTLNYYAATVVAQPVSAMLSLYVAAVSIVLVGTHAGRTWGLDRLLVRKRTGWIFW